MAHDRILTPWLKWVLVKAFQPLAGPYHGKPGNKPLTDINYGDAIYVKTEFILYKAVYPV